MSAIEGAVVVAVVDDGPFPTEVLFADEVVVFAVVVVVFAVVVVVVAAVVVVALSPAPVSDEKKPVKLAEAPDGVRMVGVTPPVGVVAGDFRRG